MKHLVLTGGPRHDFSATSNALIDLLDPHGFDSMLVADLDEALGMIRAGEHGDAVPVDLFTVNALRWRMDDDRYAPDRAADAAVLSAEDAALLEQYVEEGGGLLAMHTAVICFDADPVWHQLCGASWNWATSSHPPVGPAAVRVTARGRTHPLTEGIDDFTINDEIYTHLDERADLDPLLTAEHDGRDHPLLWAREIGRGRVVTDLLGHGVASLSHPEHRMVITRAALWAARRTPAADDARGPGG